MKRYVLAAVGRDRPGIVASITKVLFEHNCNIEDSTMTILQDEFAVLLITSVPDEELIGSIKENLKEVEKEMGLFIDFKKLRTEVAPKGPPASHMVTVHGSDRPGIVYKTAEALSKRGINITDLETQSIGEGDEKIYVMLLEVVLPRGTDEREIERELKAIGDSLGVTINIRPIETCEQL